MYTVVQRLDYGARVALPFLTTLFCLFLGVIPLPIPYIGTVAPPLVLIAIYYWAGHRPDVFRPSMAFMLGFLNDIVNFLPIGLSAILFLCVYQIVLTQRRLFTKQPFLILWMGFVIVAVVTQLACWILVCLLNGHYIPILPILIQTLMVCAIFPIPCWLFIQMQRTILSQS